MWFDIWLMSNRRYPTILDQIRALPPDIPAAGKRQPCDTLPRSWVGVSMFWSRERNVVAFQHAGGLPWHTRGMSRIRLSTTVDSGLLGDARLLRSGLTDAALVDEALGALLDANRAAAIDISYAAYDQRPLDEPDAWGDLASFRGAAGES
jgi:hypothetical protein